MPTPQRPYQGSDPDHAVDHPDSRGTPATVDPLVPANFAGWFRRICGVIKRSLLKLVALQLITAVVGVALSIALTHSQKAFADHAATFQTGTDSGTQPELSAFGAAVGAYAGALLLGLAISVAVTALVLAASMFVAVRDADGQSATAMDGLRFAARRAPLFACWLVLAWILVIIGSFFLVIPGFYLAVVLFSSLPGVVVIERNGIGRCFALIKGRFWATAGRLLVAALIIGVYGFVAYSVTSTVDSDPASVVTSILQAIFTIPVSVAIIGIATVTYAELRVHEKVTITSSALAAELVRRNR